MHVKRIYVDKKEGFQVEAQGLYDDFKNNLAINGLQKLHIIDRYDIEGITDEEYELVRDIVFNDPPAVQIHEETLPISPKQLAFAVELLPGHFDQKADSTAQSIQLITQGEKPIVNAAKLIVMEGDVSEDELKKIKDYYINSVESRETALEKPESIKMKNETPQDVQVLSGFINMSHEELASFSIDMNLAMTFEDLQFCQKYFRETENRDPSITELRVIDTYWSDHCRHTTFHTKIQQVEFEQGPYKNTFEEAYGNYKKARRYVYGDRPKNECLMDMAAIAMKKMKKQGLLKDLDESEEVNACSIKVKVDVDGEMQDWLLMFKNETHNHPTEIEPFGGASTCLGGAIRDPLSGRSYVYQAMRITGSGDPRTPLGQTITGKLPQRRITTEAAAGYSSYGNQIGASTGQVVEIYHPGYVAKRMELGAVIAAAPKENVVRLQPQADDLIILLGGRTGRDGCGGATGSSKVQDEESLYTAGAEVQKGNPPIERNIVRLFRDPKVTRMIKKCNDFGAGGVSVAIGELAPGLDINLDLVPVKYEGLDGTELAISESQERMAVVIAPEDGESFIQAARSENLEAAIVARVTDKNRLQIRWRDSYIVDISRDFLDTNGVEQRSNVLVASPSKEQNPLTGFNDKKLGLADNWKENWLSNIQSLNVCSQRGLIERFDSTAGAPTVLLPLGGRQQLTPAEGMAAKIPLLKGETNTAALMSFGFNPEISSWSPFHGAVYAVVEAAAKITAMGGDYRNIRLSFQEFFERLGDDPGKWGKPFASLLGAIHAQESMGLPAIGGKDSMSGTFEDLTVPPTLVAFAVTTGDAREIISPEFKSTDSVVVLLELKKDENDLPDFSQLDRNYTCVHGLVKKGKIRGIHSVRNGGIAEAISKMCFGNRIGFTFEPVAESSLYQPLYGSLLLELSSEENLTELFAGLEYQAMGNTQDEYAITINGENLSLDDVFEAWDNPLESVFPAHVTLSQEKPKIYNYKNRYSHSPAISVSAPRVFIPAFPGTNCEYDAAYAFEKAGAVTDILVMRNLTAQEIKESISEMAERIGKSQILMIPGGYSGGDELFGSGKFIEAAFRNPEMKDAIMELLNQRDGLILGISNGFQALIGLGLVPYGEIRDIKSDSPTLTSNTIGRHMSRMVQTRISSLLSPWLAFSELGAIHTIPISHGQGRFIAEPEMLKELAAKGQIATQYVDLEGNPTNVFPYNPNGSVAAIEGITSPDGRVFGKMGHSQRIGAQVGANVPGEKDQMIFESGVRYFK